MGPAPGTAMIRSVELLLVRAWLFVCKEEMEHERVPGSMSFIEIDTFIESSKSVETTA